MLANVFSKAGSSRRNSLDARKTTLQLWKIPFFNGIMMSENMKRLRKKSIGLLICSILSTVLSILQLALAYRSMEKRGKGDLEGFHQYATVANVARIILVLNTLRFMYLTIQYYKEKLVYDLARKLVPLGTTFWRSYLRGNMIRKLLYCLILPYPFVEDTSDGAIFYIIFSSLAVGVQMSSAKTFLYYSYPIHAQDGRLCVAQTMAPFKPDLIVKRLIDAYPLGGGFIVFVAYILPASYLFMLVENARMYDAKWKNIPEAESYNPVSFNDSVWLMLVTMTTIGYGDVRPQTFIGKVLIAVAGVFAVFANAMFFSLVVKYFYFTPQELKVFNFLSRATRIVEQKKASVAVIESCWRNYCAYRNSITWLSSKIKGMYYRELQQRQITETEVKDSLARLKASEGTLYRDIIDNDSTSGGGPLEACALNVACLTTDIHKIDKAMKRRRAPPSAQWGQSLTERSKEIEEKLATVLNKS